VIPAVDDGGTLSVVNYDVVVTSADGARASAMRSVDLAADDVELDYAFVMTPPDGWVDMGCSIRFEDRAAGNATTLLTSVGPEGVVLDDQVTDSDGGLLDGEASVQLFSWDAGGRHRIIIDVRGIDVGSVPIDVWVDTTKLVSAMRIVTRPDRFTVSCGIERQSSPTPSTKTMTFVGPAVVAFCRR
jgi:hypothetical protein